MRATICSIRDNQRGSATVGWIGATALVVALIAGVWQALYGGSGQALKAVVQQTVFRYADGFEGGLGSQGPSARYPSIGARRSYSRSSRGDQSLSQASDGQASASLISSGQQSSSSASLGDTSSGQQSLAHTSAGQASDGQDSAGAGSLAQDSAGRASLAETSAGRPSNGLASAGVGFNPETGVFVVIDPATRRRFIVRPQALIQSELDPSADVLRLNDPAGNRAAVLSAYEDRATLIDTTTGAEVKVSLNVLQQLGMIEIEHDSSDLQQSFIDGVLGVPWLVGG